MNIFFLAKKIRELILLPLLISASVAYSQELVNNGSFEVLNKCPTYVGDIECANGWHNGGFTPDLFSTCTGDNDNGLNIPDSYQGNIRPIDGNACAGLVLFSKKNSLTLKKSYEYSESIWSKLNTNLAQGKKYSISLWVSLSDSSVLYSRYVTVTLSSSPFSENKSPVISQMLALNTESISYDYKSRPWINLLYVFISDRPWNYISIGISKNMFDYKEFINSVKNNSLVSKNILKQDANCYYFIDNISLKEIDTK